MRPSENDLSWLTTFESTNATSTLEFGKKDFKSFLELSSDSLEKWIFGVEDFNFGGQETV
jgi:hypothetical protein